MTSLTPDDTSSSALDLVVGDPAPIRADAAVGRHFPGAGRRRIAELFDEGGVHIGRKRLRKGDIVESQQHLTLSRAPWLAEDLRVVADPAAAERLTFLLERADLLAVNKPAAMPSQPLRAGELGSAASGIVAKYPECATVGDDPREGGLVHRLDGDTTGVLLAARNQETWSALRAAFGSGEVSKTYLALTFGTPQRLRCDSALSQRGDHVIVDEADGLAASTEFEVVAEAGGLAWVKCTAHTGRMHQVRAHLASVGAPLLGDVRYGGPASEDQGGFTLHASTIEVPLGDERVKVTAPLPAALQARLAALGLS